MQNVINKSFPADTLRILVGSQNPVKIAAAKAALEAVYPHTRIECQGIAVASGVADQPMTATETRKGAINRACACHAHGGADLYIAMEGGVDRFEDGPATFAYVVIINANGERTVGRSAQLPLPEQVFAALEAGEELGHVIDRLFNTVNIKQAGGAIGLLTHNAEDRQSSYRQALILAMAPLLNPRLYATASRTDLANS